MDENTNFAPAFGFLSTAANNAQSQQNAKISFKRQRQMMQEQNMMNLANAKSMSTIQAQGLRMAGFNPAMMNGAGSASAPTASLGSADMAQTFPLDFGGLVAAQLAGAQQENLSADTAGKKEEARGKQIVNDQVEAANDAFAQTYIGNIDRELADLNDQLSKAEGDKRKVLENRIAELEESKAKINDPSFRGALGIARGIKSASEAARDNWKVVENFLEGKLSKDVLQKKIDDGAANFLAAMPEATLREIRERINNIRQNTSTAESAERLNSAQVGKIQADIEAIGDAVTRARLSDENWLRMLKTSSDPETRKIGEDGLKNLTDTEFRKLKYDVGAGVVKSLATGGAIGGASAIGNKILNSTSAPDKFDASLKEHDRRKNSNPHPEGWYSGSGVQNFKFR